MRFTLTNVLLFIALIASVCGTIQGFWNPNWGNHITFFGLYCILVSAATAGAIFDRDRPAFRRVWVGMAIFGWTYLAFVLKGATSITAASDVEYFAQDSLRGMALFAISGLTTYLWFSFFAKEPPKV